MDFNLQMAIQDLAAQESRLMAMSAALEKMNKMIWENGVEPCPIHKITPLPFWDGTEVVALCPICEGLAEDEISSLVGSADAEAGC